MDAWMRRHRDWRSFASSALLVAALSGCHGAALAQPAAAQPDSVEHAAPPPSDSDQYEGGRKYRECVAAAGDDARTRARCLEDELTYQYGGMERFLWGMEVKLDPARARALRAEQREWEEDTDRLCAAATVEARPASQLCRLQRTRARIGELGRLRSELDPEFWAKDQPDADGSLQLRLGDTSIEMQSDGCIDRMVNILICSNVRLAISTPELSRQTVFLPEVWLPKALRPDRDPPAIIGARGSLEAGFSEGRNGIILTDIDEDGHEDLMVWSGPDGSYGDPSYTYYLYDPQARRLVENTALAALMEGHSLSRIVRGRIYAWYRSGPCDRGEKLIEVHDAVPRIVARRDYAACGENALDAEEIFDDSWMTTPQGEPTP
ncbi:XAC2610-related protein [Luteimonas huabeiensis]|uniref:XAC2610-related protein n=1 Tax=Luteimonas huabeiensis TaxID=1244513 RepID=UPI001268DEC4|nr:lysozyme inhibitor LprI family protein [Luteimonas huabeiensis]